MTFNLGQIAQLIGGSLEGNPSTQVRTIQSIESASEGSITFLSNPKYEHFIYETKASAVIVKKGLKLERSVSTSLIKVEDPYSAFTLFLEEYQRLISFKKKGIEQPCFLGDAFEEPENVYIGAFSYIGTGVSIG